MLARPASLIFVHGTAAHCHWFDHIAPFLVADGYDVVAIDLSGFGDSGTRDSLNTDMWAKEVVCVCQAAGLFDKDRGRKPVVVGHSLGSFVAEAVVQQYEDHFDGLIVMDGGIPHPFHWLLGDKIPSLRRPERKREYPLSIVPQSRFKFMPPQQIRLPWLHEHIANKSVKYGPVAGTWTWKFDPSYQNKLEFGKAIKVGVPEMILGLRNVRVAVLYGRQSIVVNERTQNYMRMCLGEHISVIAIPDAEHHCFLDQPLACVTALRSILSEWGRSATSNGHGLLIPRPNDRSTHSVFEGGEAEMRAASRADSRLRALGSQGPPRQPTGENTARL